MNAKIPNLSSSSPIPSPDINAPSPEPDNDFDIPGDINFYNSTMNGFGSFLGNDSLPFDLNEFYRDSPPPVDQNSIQVIHSQEQQQQSTAPLNDFYNSLIPSKLEAYNPEMNYGGSYQQKQPPLPPAGPPMVNYANTATASYMIAPPPPPAAYNPSQIDYASQMSSGIPLPPPSMDNTSDEYSWNSWNSTPVETPHSPPHFERKGHESNMIEYIDESLRNITDSNDVDHRQLMGSIKGELRKLFQARVHHQNSFFSDVDHRNLISLTGSPGNSKDTVSTRGTHRFESFN